MAKCKGPINTILSLCTIVGARPQFVKAAAVSRAIAESNRISNHCRIKEKIIHTGQHYDDNMSRVFFEELNVPEPYLNLGLGGGIHGAQTGRMLEQIEQVLLREKPDMCMVYGDTNSTLAGALAAAKLHIPVAHVEAGLRSYDKQMPEEINRVLTDHVSHILFCPTETGVKNLELEGIRTGIYLVGDVMYDCALFYTKRSISIEPSVLRQFGLKPKSFFLATIHRSENTDNPIRLGNIFDGLNSIATARRPVILPIHPRTAKLLKMHHVKVEEHVRLVDPASYLEMIVLERNARLILTDSGGVQKEAFFFKVPCITLRDVTEWPETLQNQANVLLSPTGPVAGTLPSFLERTPSTWPTPFGHGNASEIIVRIFCEALTA